MKHHHGKNKSYSFRKNTPETAFANFHFLPIVPHIPKTKKRPGSNMLNVLQNTTETFDQKN